MFFSHPTYPNDTVGVSCYYDVLCVPLVHLRHAAADNLLAPTCECVHTHDRVSIDAPHMDIGPGAGHNVPLRRLKKKKKKNLFTYYILHITFQFQKKIESLAWLSKKTFQSFD